MTTETKDTRLNGEATAAPSSSLCSLRDWLAARIKGYMPPFWRDGVIAFTDGRMIVTMECDEPEPAFQCRRFKNGSWSQSESSRRDPPKIDRIVQQIGDANGVAIPDVSGPPPEASELWQIIATCDECLGDGEAECDMGHMHRCNQCDGEGKEIVTHREAHIPTTVGDSRYQRQYVWLLSQLPGVQLCDSRNPDMLTARYDFGIAAIMKLEG